MSSGGIRRLVRGLLRTLRGLASATVFDLWRAVVERLGKLCLLLHSLVEHEREPVHHASLVKCIPVRHAAYKRPDPCIYDQYYLMSLGLPVTWDNPDIVIDHNGVPVVSNDQLQPSTRYRVRATIRNASTGGVVVDMPVEFGYLSFGMGTQHHPIGATAIDLGVLGSADAEAVASIDWVTPATPGHYCVQVSFAYTDDANPNNNLGQTNTDVVAAHSPAETTFTLVNEDRTRRQFRFETDTYELPPPPLCDAHSRGTARDQLGIPTDVIERHRQAGGALPDGWTIVFDPARPVLEPGEATTINAVITPPDEFRGRQPVNIHAWAEATLIGGITLCVERD